MKINLIIDSGATKMECVLADGSGRILASTVVEGANVLLAEDSDLSHRFAGVRSEILKSFHYSSENSDDSKAVPPVIDAIFFYGAGCATNEICSRITGLLAKVWPESHIEVSSDLLGAARSIHGHDAGIACILGTGSNSCVYNGAEITGNIPSLGYVLGDEGSGASLGKRLVADAFKGHLPQAVSERFMQAYNLDMPAILENVYRRPFANRFLASLVPFLYANLYNPYVYSLVLEEFKSFIKRNVAMYTGAHTLPIGFIGSIAWYFKDILKEAAESLGYTISTISQSPMEGLLDYHSVSKNEL